MKSRIFFFIMGIFLVLFGMGCTVLATGTPTVPSTPLSGENIYYVSPSGSDTNPGTYNKPWRNPGFASRRLKPGDTLVILDGTYILSRYDDDIIIPTSGREGAWITIKGEDGKKPVLKATSNLMTVFDLSGKSYIQIENLEITNYNNTQARDGIEILNGKGEHIILKNLYIHHLDEFGINISDVDDIQILDSTISYCGFGAIGGPAGTYGGWKNAKIKGCTLSYSGHYYQGSSGPGPYDRPDGFGIEPSSGPIEILDTKVEHNRGDGIDSKAENTYVHECIVANNFADGIKLWGTGSKIENCLIYGRGDGNTTSTPWACIVIDTEKPGSTFEIVNTTVDDYVGRNYIIYVQYDHPNISTYLTIKNSIFSARGTNSFVYIAPGVSLTLSHNLFYMPSGDTLLQHGESIYTQRNIGNIGDGNIYGDPMFVNPSFGGDGDYHLRTGSPAIDAGTSSGAPSIDLDGVSRPQGNGIDIGAYEK